LFWAFGKSAIDLAKPENSESGDSWFGLGPPLVIGIGLLLIGIPFMLFWRTRRTGFFDRRLETAPDDLDASPPPDVVT
jgi:hypothetical protein